MQCLHCLTYGFEHSSLLKVLGPVSWSLDVQGGRHGLAPLEPLPFLGCQLVILHDYVLKVQEVWLAEHGSILLWPFLLHLSHHLSLWFVQGLGKTNHLHLRGHDPLRRIIPLRAVRFDC